MTVTRRQVRKQIQKTWSYPSARGLWIRREGTLTEDTFLVQVLYFSHFKTLNIQWIMHFNIYMVGISVSLWLLASNILGLKVKVQKLPNLEGICREWVKEKMDNPWNLLMLLRKTSDLKHSIITTDFSISPYEWNSLQLIKRYWKKWLPLKFLSVHMFCFTWDLNFFRFNPCTVPHEDRSININKYIKYFFHQSTWIRSPLGRSAVSSPTGCFFHLFPLFAPSFQPNIIFFTSTTLFFLSLPLPSCLKKFGCVVKQGSGHGQYHDSWNHPWFLPIKNWEVLPSKAVIITSISILETIFLVPLDLDVLGK